MFSGLRSPNSPKATTFLMLADWRCSFIAMAWALISLASTTSNFSNWTTPSLPAGVCLPRLLSSMSLRATPPAVTSTDTICFSRPMYSTTSRAAPAGTVLSKNLPLSSVVVVLPAASIVTRAFANAAPVPRSKMRPSIAPVLVGTAAALAVLLMTMKRKPRITAGRRTPIRCRG